MDVRNGVTVGDRHQCLDETPTRSRLKQVEGSMMHGQSPCESPARPGDDASVARSWRSRLRVGRRAHERGVLDVEHVAVPCSNDAQRRSRPGGAAVNCDRFPGV
jgi:hypothetical protein